MATIQRAAVNGHKMLGPFGVNGEAHRIAFKAPGLLSTIEPGIRALKESGGVRSTIGADGAVTTHARIPRETLGKHFRFVKPEYLAKLELSSHLRKDAKPAFNDNTANAIAGIRSGLGDAVKGPYGEGVSTTRINMFPDGTLELVMTIPAGSFGNDIFNKKVGIRSNITMAQVASAVVLACELASLCANAEKRSKGNGAARIFPPPPYLGLV
ncbi:MAG: hypothetical protein KGH69_04910 [Candidatus Micrarchaeota archaeon]|nr:hypothetical protein [Candidatus Micrarchaeota archaeon]